MSTTTIMMPAAFQGAIKSMCEDAIGQAIKALSEKYGFDSDEAHRELKLGKIQVKAATSKGSSKKDSAEKPKSKRGKAGYLLYTGELRAEVKAEMELEPPPDAFARVVYEEPAELPDRDVVAV